MTISLSNDERPAANGKRPEQKRSRRSSRRAASAGKVAPRQRREQSARHRRRKRQCLRSRLLKSLKRKAKTEEAASEVIDRTGEDCGSKVHPYGFRLGYNKDWHSHWFAKKQFGEFLLEDLKLKRDLKQRFAGAGVSHVDIERAANRLKIIIYTSRPGIIIGRKGAEIDKLKSDLSSKTGREVLVSIQEIHKPELNAQLRPRRSPRSSKAHRFSSRDEKGRRGVAAVWRAGNQGEG